MMGAGMGSVGNGLEDSDELVETSEVTEKVESEDDCRDFRRKGTEGRRNVGNTEW